MFLFKCADEFQSSSHNTHAKQNVVVDLTKSDDDDDNSDCALRSSDSVTSSSKVCLDSLFAHPIPTLTSSALHSQGYTDAGELIFSIAL